MVYFTCSRIKNYARRNGKKSVMTFQLQVINFRTLWIGLIGNFWTSHCPFSWFLFDRAFRNAVLVLKQPAQFWRQPCTVGRVSPRDGGRPSICKTSAPCSGPGNASPTVTAGQRILGWNFKTVTCMCERRRFFV